VEAMKKVLWMSDSQMGMFVLELSLASIKFQNHVMSFRSQDALAEPGSPNSDISESESIAVLNAFRVRGKIQSPLSSR
jgi:hypothetical protein